MMLLKIAWRNLLRNKRRSLIVLTSIIVGVTALLLNDSIGRGMINQMLNNQLDSYYTHIQIHHDGFLDDKSVKHYIDNSDEIESKLKNAKYIENYSKRTVSFGLFSSAMNSTGISMIGIDPELEKHVTNIDESITEGRYLSGKEREAVIGAALAEKLEVKLGDKVVAVANSLDGDVASELYRVVGIYKTASSNFEKMYVYVSLKTSQRMLGVGDGVMEFAMTTNNTEMIDQYQNDLQSMMPEGTKVSSYKELLPMMMSYIEMYDSTVYIFYAVIIAAVLFGIINTILMSVFERVQEIGVLMSIGMKKGKIFIMILHEAFLLGVAGTVAGFIIGYAIYLPLSMNGIDFSFYSDSLSSWGLGSIMYPELDLQGILNILLIMPFASVLGAIYPAIKAMRLQPTDAMKYV